jgi:hypothetical protein
MNDDNPKSFEEAGAEGDPGLLSELWQMLKENKKFWLVPLIVGLLIFGLLILLGGTAAAPFIYTLF